MCRSLGCVRQWDLSYDELLTYTELPSLKARHTQACLCHLFKIIHYIAVSHNLPMHLCTTRYLHTTLAPPINLLFVYHRSELVHVRTHHFQQQSLSGVACQKRPGHSMHHSCMPVHFIYVTITLYTQSVSAWTCVAPASFKRPKSRPDIGSSTLQSRTLCPPVGRSPTASRCVSGMGCSQRHV